MRKRIFKYLKILSCFPVWFGLVYWPRGCTLTNSGMWFDLTNTIVDTFVKRLSSVARITHHIQYTQRNIQE